MFKRFLTFIVILTLYNVVSAQEIKGIVKDSLGLPIRDAIVVLFSLPDTIQVSCSITNVEGRFTINSKNEQEHLLYISLVGYIPKYAEALPYQEIIMDVDVLAIDEVVVKGSRPISKMTTSGVQTTVANTFLSEMGTGNEVLKRIPMVMGSKGNFEIFGKGTAKIYINNREVRDASELDNLNAKDIQSIEVISNPGARYDASVKAVINIKTVKRQGDGVSFNARSSFYTWQYQDYINQINTNYRKGGLDIFVNGYYSNTTTTQIGDANQTIEIDTLWQQNSNIDRLSRDNNLNATIGANYEINPNHCIGFRYDIKTSPANNVDDTNLKSVVYADSIYYDHWDNNEHRTIRDRVGSQANLYYKGSFEKLSINFNADYMSSGSRSDNINRESSKKYGDRTLSSFSNIGNRLWVGKLQLAYPVLKGEISSGTEYVSITRSDEYVNNDLTYFSSMVDIKEQNIAFFAEYQIASKIGNFSAGVRYENADYDYIVDYKKDTSKSRRYKQWFPNFSYSHNFGGVAIQLSYNSKVVRPSYSQLSNNFLYDNRFTMVTGNPLLKPTINQDVSLAGLWKFIQVQVNYNLQKDAIVMWIDRYDKDPKVSLINYKNISKLPRLTTSLTIAPTFGFWKPQLTIAVQKYWQDYREYGLDIDMKEPLYYISLNNTFELPYAIIVNLDAGYQSKGYGATIYSYKDVFRLNFDIAKNFLNKTLQVKLGISDITNAGIGNLAIMPRTKLKYSHHFNHRKIQLTVRYYFNPTNNKYKGGGAGQSAKERL